jgi:hypothetical protein
MLLPTLQTLMKSLSSAMPIILVELKLHDGFLSNPYIINPYLLFAYRFIFIDIIWSISNLIKHLKKLLQEEKKRNPCSLNSFE